MFGQYLWKIYSRYLCEFDGKDYDQEYFDGDVKYHLGLTADKVTSAGKKSISI
jgi:2-oxoglutarate dehydrogenase complex dehydrogenase (E1) component-like enzyme